MDQLFEATFSPLASSGKPLSRCGQCRRYMRLIAARPTRLYCPTCDEIYNVPQVMPLTRCLPDARKKLPLPVGNLPMGGRSMVTIPRASGAVQTRVCS